MKSPWIVAVLVALAIIGGVLIVTADEGDGLEAALEEVVTDEGLATSIPEGWIESEELSFEFVPAENPGGFERWTVARACPPDGCAGRSLEEWIALAPDLPTFAEFVASEDDGVFNLETERFDDALVMRGDTQTAGRLVFVAHFVDGADAYVACAVRVGLSADPALADAIVDVCRTTTP